MMYASEKVCSNFKATKWDENCSNCRLNKGQHRGFEVIEEKLVQSAEPKNLFQIEDEDPRKTTKTSFHKFPLETLGIIFRHLSAASKIQIKLSCVSLFYKILSLTPPMVSIQKLYDIMYSVNIDEYPRMHITFTSQPLDSPTHPKDLSFGCILRPIIQKNLIVVPNRIQKNMSGINNVKIQETISVAFGERRYQSYLGLTVEFVIYSENMFGITKSSPRKYLIPQSRHTYYNYCFNEEAPIHLADSTTMQVRDIKIGDKLLTSCGEITTVQHIKITKHNTMHKMVDMGDFLITVGHPIFKNGTWYRPDELFPVVSTYITKLYNFYCYPHHFLVVGESNPTVVTSLGGYCPRIAELDPYSDIIYGSGYGTEQAKRYEWLLSLKERIPNEDVERETEKYWARVRQEEFNL